MEDVVRQVLAAEAVHQHQVVQAVLDGRHAAHSHLRKKKVNIFSCVCCFHFNYESLSSDDSKGKKAGLANDFCTMTNPNLAVVIVTKTT